MNEEYILQMEGISKQFSSVKVLHEVDFRIKKGEVHALMGENGAGKSTLIKILTGIYRKDAGTIRLDGREIIPSDALEAQELGISPIYQDISVVGQLTVAENIYVGREIKKHGVIDWKTTNQKSREILRNLGIDIDVTKPLSAYGTAIQQMVAIARSILIDAKLVVMDEATSSLDEDEVRVLFQIIRRLKDEGISVLFISHRLSEVFEISDTITVLKDGYLVGEYETASLTKTELVSKMIGRNAQDVVNYKRKQREVIKEEYLNALGIQSGIRLKGYDLTIHRGEVVGLAGLLGSGRTELARILFGVDRMDRGEIYINGAPVEFRFPYQAIGRGLAFCSEDRKVEGIFPDLSLAENISISNMKAVSRFGMIQKKKMQKLAEEYIEKIRIKTSGAGQKIRALSGGNQQKVILSRWMAMNPDLIILDEPTRGIDVGAKKEIEDLIREIASKGISVLLISSEFEELIRNCDRVEVIREGENAGTLSGEAITEENILEMIANGAAGKEAKRHES
ncbi:MAG: sugar ABC transporter ATP-binding protein [Lachnospiraceae bacterium]|nr:sugar ABC transporter ATP-binding protein [Lachnospiraceae bacterium]